MYFFVLKKNNKLGFAFTEGVICNKNLETVKKNFTNYNELLDLNSTTWNATVALDNMIEQHIVELEKFDDIYDYIGQGPWFTQNFGNFTGPKIVLPVLNNSEILLSKVILKNSSVKEFFEKKSSIII